jgi:glycosyltransferase involved in cell wall biosynthesis
MHIFPSFQVGGPQVRFVELVKGFGDLFSHTVIATNNNHDAASLLPPGALVAYADSPLAHGMLGRLASYRRDIAARAPDLLVTYNWGAIEWALANGSLDTPHVHIEDGFGPEEINHQIARRVWTRRLALRRSEVVVPSITLQDMATQVWRLSKRHVHYIPNGLEPRDRPITPIEDLGLILPQGLPRIAFAGALRREKNLVRLLRAFAPLKKEAVLLVAGDGPEMTAVLEEAEKLSLGSSIRMLGRREDVRDILMQSDVLALSSDTEQMPLAVLEGMDAGLPIAAMRVGDVGHMVSRENQPFVVTGSDAELGAAMQALVANAAIRKAVGTANRKRSREVYQAKDMIGAYRALFLETAGARNGGLKSCA